MKEIYTCPYCHRQYTVGKAGNYICDCGIRFNYPEILKSVSCDGYDSGDSQYLPDMNGAGVRSSVRFNILNTDTTWLRCRTPVDCPYAKLSLVCGVLGLIFFGILSVPALVLGLFARDQILNYHNNYKGAWIALTGIFTGALGIAIWGIFFLLES